MHLHHRACEGVAEANKSWLGHAVPTPDGVVGQPHAFGPDHRGSRGPDVVREPLALKLVQCSTRGQRSQELALQHTPTRMYCRHSDDQRIICTAITDARRLGHCPQEVGTSEGQSHRPWGAPLRSSAGQSETQQFWEPPKKVVPVGNKKSSRSYFFYFFCF